MNPTPFIEALGSAGGEWVLYLLLYFSMFSVTLILERIFYFWGNREPAGRLIGAGVAALAREDFKAVETSTRGPVGRMLCIAAEAWPQGPQRLYATVLAHRLQEKAAAERTSASATSG